MHAVHAYVRGVCGGFQCILLQLQAVAWKTRSRVNEESFETKEGHYYITELFVMQCTIIINNKFKLTYQKTVTLQYIVLYFLLSLFTFFKK